MNKVTAAITAVGAFVPDYVLSNQVLETMVDTNDEWITTRTGIKERRLLKEKGQGTSYMAIRAAKDLIAKSGIDPLEIDMVLMATTTPDMPVAATGVYGMSTAAAYIESGRYKKVLLIGADKMSSIIDYTDRATCIIFGDGAGAVLFEPNTDGLGLRDEFLRSDGIGREYLKIDAGGSILPASAETVANRQHYVFQDGKTVFKYAVTGMADVSEKIMQRNGLTRESVDWLLAHQANKRIIDATAQRMELDDEKVLVNIHRYGNTTSATLPLLMHDFEDKFKKGDNLIFAAFGGGFTWGAIYLKWAYDKK